MSGLAIDDIRMIRLIAVNGVGLLDEALDGLELCALLPRHEGDRRAGFARAGRTADAVDVALGLKRKLHVDDAGDVRHVDAAARDVRRDKNAHLAVAKTVQRTCTLSLRLVRMNRRAADVLPQEFLDDAVRPMAHLREDDDLRPFGMSLEEMDEKRVLAGLLDEHHLLVNLLDSRRLGVDRDLHRILHELAGEFGDGG